MFKLTWLFASIQTQEFLIPELTHCPVVPSTNHNRSEGPPRIFSIGIKLLLYPHQGYFKGTFVEVVVRISSCYIFKNFLNLRSVVKKKKCGKGG